MNAVFRVFSGLLLLGFTCVQDGRAQDVAPPPEQGPAYIVTFLEIDPRAIQPVTAALRAYRDAGQREAANLGLRVYQEIGQQNRFMVTETWREEANYRAHANAETAARLRDALSAVQLAPPDVRVHRLYPVGAPGVDPSTGPESAVYVQTHLDVVPPLFSGLEPLLGPFVDASRRDGGVLRFELLQHVAPRQNHLTLMEAWRTEADLNAHRVAPHTREFRDEILPILGSLYDERLYRLVD